MKISANPDWLQLLKSSAANSISTNNKRLTDGMSEVLISPAFEDVSDEDIREAVTRLLDGKEITDTLQEIEDDNLSKLGPRSIAIPWTERKESLSAYFAGKEYCKLTAMLPMQSLRPTSFTPAFANLVSSSNSGLPFMVRQSALGFREAHQFFLNEGVDVKYPCVLYTRTAEQKKTRNIWGFPFYDKVQESRFAIPYIELEKRWSHRAALLGPDYVDSGMTAIMNAKSEDEDVVCLDFDAFDASVTCAAIAKAFAFISAHFQKGYFNELFEINQRFQTIPIWTPDGQIEGPHGVPSGSGFTNTVDSEIQRQASTTDRRAPFQIQGDDGVYLCGRDKVQSFTKAFEFAGLRVNRSKTRVFSGREGVYLQRYYHDTYTHRGVFRGVYPVARALARIKYLESFTDLEKIGIEGRDYFALRTIMILENCKYHPAFQDLVRYVQSRDKYGLNYSNKGLKAFSRAMESKARAGQFLSQQELRGSGLSSFETVKLLTELWDENRTPVRAPVPHPQVVVGYPSTDSSVKGVEQQLGVPNVVREPTVTG